MNELHDVLCTVDIVQLSQWTWKVNSNLKKWSQKWQLTKLSWASFSVPSHTVFSRSQRLPQSPICLDNKVARTFEGSENDAQESFRCRHFWLHCGMAILILIWHCRNNEKFIVSSGVWTRIPGFLDGRSINWAIKPTGIGSESYQGRAAVYEPEHASWNAARDNKFFVALCGVRLCCMLHWAVILLTTQTTKIDVL